MNKREFYQIKTAISYMTGFEVKNSCRYIPIDGVINLIESFMDEEQTEEDLKDKQLIEEEVK